MDSLLFAESGELVWDHTNTLFWQMRGWELRGWLCETMRCAQYFSVILLVRQLLLCDMAYISEYVDGEVLAVSMLPGNRGSYGFRSAAGHRGATLQ